MGIAQFVTLLIGVSAIVCTSVLLLALLRTAGADKGAQRVSVTPDVRRQGTAHRAARAKLSTTYFGTIDPSDTKAIVPRARSPPRLRKASCVSHHTRIHPGVFIRTSA